MAALSFAKGLKEKYAEKLNVANSGVTDSTIFFATDTHEIIIANQPYGVSTSIAADVANKVAQITYNSPDSLVFKKADGTEICTITLDKVTTTKAGLMSAEDKVILDTLNGSVDTTGSVKQQVKVVQDDVDALEVVVAENKVTAADKSVVVTPGSTVDGTTTGTTIKVNVKSGDNALKLDSANGLYVDQSALTSYEGKDAVKIADKSGVDGVKEVSIKLDGTSLVQSADGLKANLTIVKLTAEGDDAATYQLQDRAGNGYGEKIHIAKDQHLKSVELDEIPSGQEGAGDAALKFVWFVTEGGTTKEKTTYVNVSNFLDEAEAGNGLETVEHKFTVKVDAASEKIDGANILSVSADGVKISGVKTAIDKAAAEAKTEVVAKADGHVHVTVEPQTDEGKDGHNKVTISETDIASAELLGAITDDSSKNTAFGKTAAEAARAKGIEEAIIGAVGLTASTGAFKANAENYTGNSIGAEIKAIDAQLKSVSDQLQWVEIN